MKKISYMGLVFGILFLSIGLASAIENHQSEIEEGRRLVESNISCGKLTNEQLEAIGDYYMEQMHPGEAHELMHEMMGGHNSEVTKNMHVNMAESIYCGETNQGMMGMMNMMSGGGMMDGSMMSNGMMSGGMMMGKGMMGNYYYQDPQNNSIYQNSFFGFQIFFYIILILIIIILVLVVILLINKSKQKGGNNKR